ncbi:MAG: hypothetical protein EOP21_01190 [Hyphomicrobiales bacterium]|nr:MAG: hypothetical protein EOP21_01190 [Hyphomicrobiales bacterium]
MFLGTLACLLPGSMVILSGDKLQSPDAYRLFGIWLAFLILLFGASCLIGIWRAVLALPAPLYEEEPPPFSTEVANLTRNPSFIRVFLAAILILVGQGITLALNIHAFRYFWQIPADQTQLPLMALVLGQAIGLPIAAIMSRLAEKRSGMMFAVIVTAIYTLAITLVASAGLLPVGTRLSLGLVLMNAIVLGASSTLFVVSLFSMMADAVDEHDHLFGVKREALYAAALLLGAKAATGIGGFIAGVGLELIGFSTATGEGGAIAGSGPLRSTEAIDNLGLLWGVVPPFLLFLSLPLLFGYALTKKRHAFIIEQLSARGADSGGVKKFVSPPA